MTEPARPEAVGPLAGLRGVGVMLAGSIALNAAAFAGLRAMARALRDGRRPGALPGAGVVMTLLYALVLRTWMIHWGASDAETEGPLPGDELAARPGVGPTRAVTIDAPPEEVWPWLAQIGADRGGFYSYEWLENLAGCRMRNASRIHPEWQERELGEKVMLHPALGLEVGRFDPGQALILNGWGAFVLEPLEGGRTRLLARGHAPKNLLERVYNVLLMEVPHFIMERKMLLGIKRRAEESHSATKRAKSRPKRSTASQSV